MSALHLSKEGELIAHANNKFGEDLEKRFHKFHEEVGELDVEIFQHLYTKRGDMDRIKDELADVHYVLIHIASLFGMNIEDMIDLSLDKMKQREVNPNYKRDEQKNT